MHITSKHITAAVIVALGVVLISVASGMPESHGRAATYDTYTEMYRAIPASEYAALYRKGDLYDKGNMLAAADKVCEGTIDASFECDPSGPESERALKEWTKYSGRKAKKEK